MGVVEAFEVEVIVGDKPLRELVDPTNDKRYIIGHQGQEFQVKLTNKWNRSVAYQIIMCGTPLKHSVVLHPHQNCMYQNYISTTEVSPFLLSVPVLQRVEQSDTGNNTDLSSVPTLKVKIYSVAKLENPVPNDLIDYSISNLGAVTSTNNKKASAPLVVTTGAPKKAAVGIAAKSGYSGIAVISSIQFWARSNTSLYVDGILAKCWPSMFEDWGKERPKLCVPSFSCGFSSVAMDTFSPRESIQDEQQALDKTLKRCGLHLKQEVLMTLAETLSCVLCGTKDQHEFITKKFKEGPSKMLQLFSNYFGVPIFVYQYNDKNTNNNDPAPQKLVVYETQPSEESKIWPVGYSIAYLGSNKWVSVELHDFIDLDDIDDEEENKKKEEEEERLNTIRTRLEELKRQEAERLKQMEELRRQEEDIINANPAKKIKTEKK